MRARGADVTDIVVLVVAANDGIMPQTREAIAHSKAAGKTIIVAINKCDLPAADPVKTKSGLMEEGLVPTDFGGDVECVEVSALTGAGIDDLLGLLVLQSEVLELQANPKANCRASIIEAAWNPARAAPPRPSWKAAPSASGCPSSAALTPARCAPWSTTTANASKR